MKLIDIVSNFSEDVATKCGICTSKNKYMFHEIKAITYFVIELLHKKNVKKGDKILFLSNNDEKDIFILAAGSALGVTFFLPYNISNITLTESLDAIELIKFDHIIYTKKDTHILNQISHIFENLIYIKTLRQPRKRVDLSKIQNHMEHTLTKHFLVLFSSGSTDKPKAIVISEDLVGQRIFLVSKRLKFEKNARIFISGPLTNTTGIIFAFGSIYAMATLFFPETPRFTHWFYDIQRFQITHLMLRPVAMQPFLSKAAVAKNSLDFLRVIAYGAAPLSSRLLEKGRALCPCDWVQGYGLSETFGPFSWLDEADHALGIPLRYTYCVGKPDETTSLKIDKNISNDSPYGEILIKSNHMMEGYYDLARNNLIEREEWLRTGDWGYVDENGLLILKGRIAEKIFNHQGHRLAPLEIENIVQKNRHVELASLVHIKHQYRQQRIEPLTIHSSVLCLMGPIAFWSAKKVSREMQDILKIHLNREKWPDFLCVIKEKIPINSNLKVNKHALSSLINPTDLIPLIDGDT